MRLHEKLAAALVVGWARREGPKAVAAIKGGDMTLIVQLLSYVVTLKFLDGYRTYAAGVGTMLSGAALIALAVAGDPAGDLKVGVFTFLGGLTIVGGAGKADKLTAVGKASAVLQVAVAPEDPTVGKGVDRARIDEALEVVAPPKEKPAG